MVTIGLALVPVHAAVMLWMPRLLGQTLDLLTAGAGSDQLAPTCWLMLGLAGAEAAARFVSRRLIIDSSRLVEQQIKDELVAHIQRLPTPWFDKARTGDLTSRMTQDVELVRTLVRELDAQPATLPRGGTLTARRFLMLGLLCGSASGMTTLHDLLELSIPRVPSGKRGSATLPDAFLLAVEAAQDAFETNPIYWLLHETIYCDGPSYGASNWSAERVQAQTGAEIVITESNDPRSYRQDSSKLLATGFKPEFSVQHAIEQITEAYQNDALPDGEHCYTVKWMKHLQLQANS